jgi:hypothetical protein
MGHTSDRTVMIYLHATEERHREIADVLSAMAKTQLKKAKPKKPSGTERARKGKPKA